MATLHELHHLPRSSRDTVFLSHVVHAESGSETICVLSSSVADCARLRCNRAEPCEHCTKRGDGASCSYATLGDLHTHTDVNSGKKIEHAGKQLHCLENLVVEAIKIHNGRTQSPVRNIVPFTTKLQ